MNLSQYKTWLEGYLSGCGVKSQAELTDEQMRVVIDKLSQVNEEEHSWKFPVSYPREIMENIRDWSIPSWLRGRGHYTEKVFYEDSDGNYVEIENDNGKINTRSNLKSVDRLQEAAATLIGDTLDSMRQKSA